MNHERESCLAVHFSTTTEGQCSQRMQHILLTQWGILNLFSFWFCIKIDPCLRLQDIIQKKNCRSDLLSAYIQLRIPVKPADSHLALLSDISVKYQYWCLNLLHSTLLLHTCSDLIELLLTRAHRACSIASFE